MSLYSQEDIRRLQHCIYLTFLNNPRMYFTDGSKKCNSAKNTFMKYWKKGLLDLIFFPPQIRIKMYNTRKEYVYLVECDNPHELFEYYKKHPDVIYLVP